MKKNATVAERKHMADVASLGCILCRKLGYMDTPCQIHHIRSGQGWGRSSHYETIGLCESHHTGNKGVHGLGTKGFVRHYGFTERELLEDVYRLLGKTLEE